MKKIFILLVTVFALCLFSFESKASYIYTEFGGIDASEPMKVKKILDSNSLVKIEADGTETKISIGEIVDMVQCEDLLYILDKTNACFHVLDKDYHVVGTYTGNAQDDKSLLHQAEGIYVIPTTTVDKQGNVFKAHKIYIADTQYKHMDDNNNPIYANADGEISMEPLEGYTQKTGRIFTLTKTSTHKFTSVDKLIYEKPLDPSIKDIAFNPVKITVDPEGRVYCIAQNIYEGIIDYNPDGTFNRFFGSNKVSSLGFWSFLYSASQRKKVGVKLQTQFNNLIIDDKNFILTVSKSTETQFVQRLNYQGTNILKQNGMVAVKGDVSWQQQYDTIPTGPSNFVDIDYNENGYYSVLDDNRSRVFTYDLEGNLLYVFGQKGTLQTSSQKAVSLTYFDEDILVSDRTNNNIIVYEPTEFGKLINEATSLNNKGLYEEAKILWEEILKINSNCLLAYTGIGISEYKQGNYKAAMENFEKGYDRENYSKAFKENRKQEMEKYYPVFMVLIIAGVGWVFVSSFKGQIRDVKEGVDN